jgi:hypothetical protein
MQAASLLLDDLFAPQENLFSIALVMSIGQAM